MLKNVGLHYESWKTGVQGSAFVDGLVHGRKDLTFQKWFYKVGLKGEAMNLVSPTVASSADWMQRSLATRTKQTLNLYKTNFDAPDGNEPLALDIRRMGKGQVWINGQSIGRYWMAYAKGDCSSCSYIGTFQPTKCQLGCGRSTQRWYHVPLFWLNPTKNLVVVFEELRGDPSKITLVK